MTEHVGSVEIFNRHTESYEEGEVYMHLDERHLADFEQEWRPTIRAKALEIYQDCIGTDGKPDRVALIDGLGQFNIQDQGWDWRQKIDIYGGRLSKVSFAIECNGKTQGLMLADLGSRRSKIRGEEGLPLVYIDFIAVAPWNRPVLAEEPRYKGVGSVLLVTAISLSIDEEMEGRIGLHSLPQSEGFYAEYCGMTSHGPEGDEGLHYFEMTADQAHDFLVR